MLTIHRVVSTRITNGHVYILVHGHKNSTIDLILHCSFLYEVNPFYHWMIGVRCIKKPTRSPCQCIPSIISKFLIIGPASIFLWHSPAHDHKHYHVSNFCTMLVLCASSTFLLAIHVVPLHASQIRFLDNFERLEVHTRYSRARQNADWGHLGGCASWGGAPPWRVRPLGLPTCVRLLRTIVSNIC